MCTPQRGHSQPARDGCPVLMVTALSVLSEIRHRWRDTVLSRLTLGTRRCVLTLSLGTKHSTAGKVHRALIDPNIIRPNREQNWTDSSHGPLLFLALFLTTDGGLIAYLAAGCSRTAAQLMT